MSIDPKAAGVERAARIVALGRIAAHYEADAGDGAFDRALDAAFNAGRKSLRAVDAAPGGGDDISDEQWQQAVTNAPKPTGPLTPITGDFTAAPAPNVQALVAACKPFAHAAEPIINNGEDWQPDEWMNRLVKINVGQYRALAQALAAIQAPAGEGVTPPAGDRGQG